MENTCVKKGSHLNIEERRMIAILTAEGKSPYAIAKLLGRASNTIRNELKRGTTNIIRGYFEYEGYFPDTGQTVYEKNRLKCRQPMKLKTCKDYIAYVEQEVLEKKRSFACVHAEVIAKGIFNKDEVCSIGTLYTYTNRCLLKIRNIDLPEKAGRRVKRKTKKDKKHKRLKGISIEQRPETISSREQFGHWEIDLVIGKQSKDRVLLTLTERKTRKEIIRRISGKTVRAVGSCLKRLQKEIPHFDKVFRSITTDNGSEFAQLWKTGKKMGIDIYYAHPYSSYERGSNENANRIIRRFVRKGTAIKVYTKKQIQEVKNWINTMYRKILGWRTSEECYAEEVQKLLAES